MSADAMEIEVQDVSRLNPPFKKELLRDLLRTFDASIRDMLGALRWR